MLEGCVGWPEEFAERYRTAGYWRGVALGESLRRSAAEHGDRVAIVCGQRRLTYRALDARADRLATGLHRLGIRPRDRVVVHLPNTAEFAELLFALLRLGALPVLALPPHRDIEIGHLCRLAGAVAYVIPDEHLGYDYRGLARRIRADVPSLRHVLVAGRAEEFVSLSDVDEPAADLPDPDPSDVALFLLSGGTTGLPKLIPRTHDDYAYNARASAELCGFGTSTVYLATLPVAHNFALACPGVLGTWECGGTVVMASSPSPEETFPLIEAERVTATALVPPLALLWLDAVEWSEADLSSLQLLQVGGAKLQPEAGRRVEPALGCRLQQVFGMAEGLLNYTRLDDPAEIIATTQGRPLSVADEVRIVDENGVEVAPGEVGELQTRGPYTLRGYYRAAEANRTAFTPDGFYCSGDLVRRSGSGHLVVQGRVNDVINRGGEKVPVEEVENVLLAHPAVHDVTLVGMPDEIMGERTCAYVVPSGRPPTLAELCGFLRERGVAAFKFPDRLEVVDRFPQTSVGKVSRKALARDIAAKLTARSSH